VKGAAKKKRDFATGSKGSPPKRDEPTSGQRKKKDAGVKKKKSSKRRRGKMGGGRKGPFGRRFAVSCSNWKKKKQNWCNELKTPITQKKPEQGKSKGDQWGVAPEVRVEVMQKRGTMEWGNKNRPSRKGSSRGALAQKKPGEG